MFDELEPIAIACYNVGVNLYCKRLYNQAEVETVQHGADEDIAGQKVIIVKGKDLEADELT